jgi:hypothetical protein
VRVFGSASVRAAEGKAPEKLGRPRDGGAASYPAARIFSISSTAFDQAIEAGAGLCVIGGLPPPDWVG